MESEVTVSNYVRTAFICGLLGKREIRSGQQLWKKKLVAWISSSIPYFAESCGKAK